MRGRVVRIQRNNVLRARVLRARRVLSEEVENSADVNILIARILVYSAMKIRANGPALYSILNPETSSDSPSTKS